MVRQKKAAIELSMGTVVILVLAMAMLVLGLIFIRGIFTGGTVAITKLGEGVNKEIDDLFTKTDAALVIYPGTRKLSIKQGKADDGFAFSVRNKDLDPQTFKFEIGVDPYFDIQDQCNIRASVAESWLSFRTGSVTLGASQKMDLPRIVVINVPETAPANCPIYYLVNIEYQDGTPYTQGEVILTVKPK